MNQMNVTGMNPGAGGPVGGVPMMNNGSTAPRNDGNVNNIPETMINNLNTYIYDYFLKRGYHECARALVKDESIKLNTEPPTKTSPGHRREDMNGVEGDAMMTDSKDGDKMKIPDDLPRPNLASESQQSSFLLDWFSLFWDFFWAQRKKGNSNDVRQYLQHTQVILHFSCCGWNGSNWYSVEYDAAKRAATQPIVTATTGDARTDGSAQYAPQRHGPCKPSEDRIAE
jgi:hypothetical protein